MDGLVPGRIVYYVLNEAAVDQIIRRRTTGDSIRARIDNGLWPIGAQAHIGSPVHVGEIVPMMVTRVHEPPAVDGTVNGKAQLDGTDILWVTMSSYDKEQAPGSWHWMFDGQQTRYTPQAGR